MTGPRNLSWIPEHATSKGSRRDSRVRFGGVELLTVVQEPEPVILCDSPDSLPGVTDVAGDGVIEPLERFGRQAARRRDRRCVTPRGDGCGTADEVLVRPIASSLWRRRKSLDNSPGVGQAVDKEFIQ